jgi:2-oxoglutarate ferredoxin oxidoreductase subunit delta
MPEIKIDKERCNGCEFCVLYCPKRAISLSSGFNSKGYHYPEFSDPEACTGCAMCAMVCPEVAIEVYKERKVGSSNA